jgi:hypothetical protein
VNNDKEKENINNNQEIFTSDENKKENNNNNEKLCNHLDISKDINSSNDNKNDNNNGESKEKEKMNLSEQINAKNVNENINLDLNLKTTFDETKSYKNQYFTMLNNMDEEDSESNNYYYNDQVNYTYKPSTIKKRKEKEKVKSHKNKYLSYEIMTPIKKMNKSRDNYNPVDGTIFHDQSELDFISYRIHGNKYKILYNLLYRASEDKDRSIIFHKKCEQAQTTLALIETKKGFRFGGYTKRTWRGASVQKNDNDAFIFTLNKRQIFNIIRGKNAIGCYDDFGPFFIGGFKIFDNAFKNGGVCHTRGLNYETSEDYELTQGEEKFQVNEIEVYEIKIA